MKKILSVLLLFLIFHSNCKTQNYHPFPVSGAEWHERQSNEDGSFAVNYRYVIQGDTIINSLLYHKIYLPEDPLIPGLDSVLVGFIREDNARKIYAIYSSIIEPGVTYQEQLILDFSKNVGDTVFLGNSQSNPPNRPAVIEKIDSVLVNGSYHREFHFEGLDTFETWIEGIGSTRGLFSHFMLVLPWSNMYFKTICFMQDSIIEYINPYFVDCSGTVAGIEDLNENENIITIYPNPVYNKSKLEISNPLPGLEKIEIYNSLGKLTMTMDTHQESGFYINAYDFPPGFYFCRVICRGGRVYSYKFIVKR